MLVVQVRVVDRRVKPPALLALHRAPDDQLRHRADVAQFEQVARHLEVPVILRDLPLQQLDTVEGPRQPLVRPDDPHVVPHRPADLVPVVGDDDPLVRFLRPAGVPLRDVDPGPRLSDVRGRGALDGVVGKDQRLDQGVRGEAVRAVEPRARALPQGEEPLDVRLPVKVRPHAAALVVRRRDHRDRLLRHVDAEREARLVDVREVLPDERRSPGPDVEIDAILPGPLHLRVDRPRDDVPRREFLHRVGPLHEPAPAAVQEDRPLAADRLGDEERLGERVVETGGVELDEFHVGDRRPGAVRQRDSVSRGDIGVARVQVHLSRTPGGEYRHVRHEGVDRAGRPVEHIGAEHLVDPRVVEGGELLPRYEVDRRVVLVDPDPGVLPGAEEERPFHLAPRQVLRVEDPPRRVSPLAMEVVLPLPGLSGELDPPPDQLADPRRGVPHHEVDRVGVAKPRPRLVGILDVGLEGVLVAPDGGDPALRVVRARLGRRLLGDDGDPAFPRRPEREAQSGDPAADDQEFRHPSHDDSPVCGIPLFDFAGVLSVE